MGKEVLGDSREWRKGRIVVQENRTVSGFGKYTWPVRQCDEPAPTRLSQSHELDACIQPKSKTSADEDKHN